MFTWIPTTAYQWRAFICPNVNSIVRYRIPTNDTIHLKEILYQRSAEIQNKKILKTCETWRDIHQKIIFWFTHAFVWSFAPFKQQSKEIYVPPTYSHRINNLLKPTWLSAIMKCADSIMNSQLPRCLLICVIESQLIKHPPSLPCEKVLL
jgi:hypothetical protein